PYPIFLFFLLPPTPPRSTLFPYTTLFRSDRVRRVRRPQSEPLRGERRDGDARVVDGDDGVERRARVNRRDRVRRELRLPQRENEDRKSTRLNSSHLGISYAVFCLKKKKRA